MNNFVAFFLHNRVVTLILLLLIIGWGIIASPFRWSIAGLPNDPVPVDAIPDIGENQQIVYTEWEGRSPQDVEDQITYPLTTTLLGMPGVKTIRSTSMFGFSSIYIIFEEGVEFYWSRSRVLEKLNALPSGLLPPDATPALGPDATALGQVFWYTLEGRDPQGKPTGGWDLQELRSFQDFYVRYSLAAVEGVSEVASIGGHVKEYQVDVDPAAMQQYGISMTDIMMAVQNSNLDVGAGTLEINKAEYFVRGIGYLKNLEDLEQALVRESDATPLYLRDVARISFGPETRRGILDKGGAEVVGGVVVARYGANPLQVIDNIKQQVSTISGGFPQKTLADGTISKLTLVPFYDRSTLIHETLGTLEGALSEEIIITIIVVIIMVLNLRASVLISSLLPVGVLMTFIAMRYVGVDANIVALSGIAIAIGTMVDLGIIIVENILIHLERAPKDEPRLQVITRATQEVAGAVITAVSTTIISFIPVFTLQAAEGKLFRPLAYTKTFALAAAAILALTILPTLAYYFYGRFSGSGRSRLFLHGVVVLCGIWALVAGFVWAGSALVLLGLAQIIRILYQGPYAAYASRLPFAVVLLAVTWLLSVEWLPLGASYSRFGNFLFVLLIVGTVLGFFFGVIYFYERLIRWAITHKGAFLSIPAFMLLLGLLVWVGFARLFGFVAEGTDALGWNIRTSKPWSSLAHTFPGTGKEFMPALDEGSFLLMPSSMPHTGVEQNLEYLQMLDASVAAIPEVDLVVGKAGRVTSALDPAPLGMYENVINYKSEYATNERGERIRFAVDDEGNFLRDEGGRLIPDDRGEYFRQWRDHIRSTDDIWQEIVAATNLPGLTSAPKLQPIETRLVMLQTGMRAPMGIKIKGSDLKTIEQFGIALEGILKQVPSVKPEAVFAERIVGKPYMQVHIDRQQAARYGISVQDVARYLEVAVGGMPITSTVEGRERYAVRIRYPRELRDSPEAIQNMLVPASGGRQIPLGQLATIEYEQGPMDIKSENTFLVGYVLFDKQPGVAEVSAVEDARRLIENHIAEGRLEIPAGTTYEFAGSYENQVRAEKRLAIIVPLCLMLIFLLLYLQFRSVSLSLMVFTGVAVAFAGGFIMLWLWGQDWFFDFSLFGTNARELFQMRTFNLSVAVWVGFIALFGIATDDGVLVGTYLTQLHKENPPRTRAELHELVVTAGSRRVRPAMMTTATTLLALLPILTSTGRGSDIMIPMAIPSFGGMVFETFTIFVVPVLYTLYHEQKLKRQPQP
ncbi:efflux RND transporter permease subunit [Cesiribacter andamanensis]|uniref:Cation efflux system protein CusA n=1 Tax=Cesiribacter andamanensis AMV16 TaxID=1279009 RepID=M7N213_9BACT|nr:efflux RND transporter permease subunit [Cesiribacter andamanensis]EMR02718.1 Cation efflux system protein CusA [Cesiribacter andamanensis AMV16]